MEHSIQRSLHARVRRDVVFHQREAFIPRQVREDVAMAGDKVVEPHDGMPVGEKAVAEMRSEETRRARDEYSHALPRPIA